MENTKTDRVKYSSLAAVSACVLTAILFKLWIGFDPDEQYAYSMMYRIVNGDHYLRDLFDAYQFSALFLSPFFGLACFFAKLFQCNPVVLTRVFSTALIMGLNVRIGLFAYRRTGSRYLAVLAWTVMITALPKSILTAEHSNLALIFLSWVYFDLYDMDRGRWPGIRLGLSCSLLSLVYPPLVALYVPISLILLLQKRGKGLAQMILVSAVILAAVLAPVVIQDGFGGLLRDIRLILMDGSHILSFQERLSAFGTDCLYLLKYIAVYLGMTAGGYGLKKILHWKDITLEFILVSVPFLFAVFQFILWPTSPMAGNGRYLLLMIACFIISLRNRPLKDYTPGILAELIAFPVIYLTSNTNLLSASGFMMASAVLYACMKQELSDWKKILIPVFLHLVIISQCVTMIFTYRTYGTLEHSIFHLDLRKDETVLSGLYYRKDAVKFFNELSLKRDSLRGDAVIVSTIFPYACVITEKKIAGPVTAATLVYNEQWETYLSSSEDESVDVILGRSTDDSIDPIPLLAMLKARFEACRKESFETFDLYHFTDRKAQE